MINPATWVISLVFFAISFFFLIYYVVETQQLQREGRRLRHEMRELEHELEMLRRITQPKSVFTATPEEPKPKSPSEKQIRQAIRDLRKWAQEDG